MKRYVNFSFISINIYILTLVIASALLIRCGRDNPFDINSPNYIAGKKPHVNFVDTLICGYLLDTVEININWSDTATGGIPGAIEKLYIDWNDDWQFSDSVTAIQANPLKILKTFNVQNNRIRIKAIDFEGDTSTVDSAWLEIKKSTPRITSVKAPEKVGKEIPFTINLNSTDTGGVITSYLWAIDEKNFSRTTDSGSLTLSFDKVGDKEIQVKARDNKKIESDIRIIAIRVTDPTDSVGPQITFLSPLDGDTVHTRQCLVSIQTNDASGVSGVTLNNTTAMQQVGSTWRGTIALKEGKNTITATAIDTKGFKSDSSIHIHYIAQSVDQNPPVVTLLAPAHWLDTIYTGTLIVKLVAIDESGVACVFFNDEQMIFDVKDSTYSITRNLQEGSNRFTVRSVDQKGNSQTDSLSVFWEKDAIDTVKPVITIFQPRYLQHITDSVATISGIVTDASRISSIKVNNIKAVLNYPTWSAKCKLNRGYDTITVTATDSSINRNSSEKSVVVIRNQPPRFIDEPHDTFVSINSVATFSATAEDDDNAITFSITRSPFAIGTLSPLISTSSKTSFTYNAKMAGTDTFKLTATDPWGDFDTTKWHVTVLAATDSTPRFIISEGDLPDTITVHDTCRTSVLARDPYGKQLTYSIINAPAGISINSLSGNITWVPGVNDTGFKAIIVQVSNGLYANTITWNVRVIPQDQPPKFSSLANQTTNENQKLQFTLNATDADNDLLEFSFGSTFPKGAVLDSNKFSWTPSFTDAGQHKVVFIVKERNRVPSLSDTLNITITVNNVNQKPVFTNPGIITGVVNQQMSITLSATDPDNDPVSYSMLNAPSGSSITVDKFSWTPLKSDTGAHYIKFIASDGSLSDTITVNVKINLVNRPPVLANPGNKTIPENQMLQITLSASDPDNDSLKFFMENAPSGSNLTGNTFSWRPGYTQAGTYPVKFIVKDNVTPPMSDTETVTITVTHVNAPPVLTSPGNQIINENERLSFTLSASDVENDSLTYSMTNAPQGTNLSGKNFVWTPSFTQAGTYKITFYVSETAAPALRDSQTITITVNDANRPPVFTDSTSKTVNEKTALQFQLLAYDPDGTTPRYYSPNLPSGANLSIYGMFNWTPDYNQAGSYRVIFIAVDSSNASAILKDTAAITINVNNVNRPPVFTDSTGQSVLQNQTLSFQLQANDPDGSRLYFSSANLPKGAVLSNNGEFYWTPTLADAWSYSVVFIVCDSSNANDALSDTATINILVKYADASMPGLISPIDKAFSQPKSITFKWTKPATATQYYFQLATDTGFVNIFLKDSTLTDTVKTVSGLANGTTYYWRVNALNGFKQSGWTARRSFRTIQVFPLTINATNGSVTTNPATGPFDSAMTVTLTAAPATGYHFVDWSGSISGQANPVGIVMNTAKAVNANFAINTYSLSTSSSSGGSVSIPASSPFPVKHGVPTPIKATANTGYHFVNWTVTSGNATIPNSSSDTSAVTLTGDASIMANFAINSYTLNVNSTAGGSIISPTPVTVNDGASTPIEAKAETGYRFLYWTVTSGSGKVTFGNIDSISTTVILTGNATVQANFIKTYTLTMAPATGGSIISPATSQVTVDSGVQTTITASAGLNYKFHNWTPSPGSKAIFGNSNDSSTTVILTGNATVQANFIKTYTLTMAPVTGGSITAPATSQVTVDSGVQTTITASAGLNYKFHNWTASPGSKAIFGNSNDSSTTVILTGNATVQADFIKTYTLTMAPPVTGGSITSPATSQVTVDSGVQTTITASANPGYKFVNWVVTSGSATIDDASIFSTTVTLANSDAVVQPIFEEETYSLDLSAETGGSTTPSAPDLPLLVHYDSTININASADPGYRFDRWTVESGQATFGNDKEFSTTVTNVLGTTVIKANFVRISYTLNMTSGVGGSVTPSGPSTVYDGTPTAISANHDDTHIFQGWNVTVNSGNVIFNDPATASTSNTTVILIGDATIQAIFEPLPPSSSE
jgi:hypothetical protein